MKIEAVKIDFWKMDGDNSVYVAYQGEKPVVGITILAQNDSPTKLVEELGKNKDVHFILSDCAQVVYDLEKGVNKDIFVGKNFSTKEITEE